MFDHYESSLHKVKTTIHPPPLLPPFHTTLNTLARNIKNIISAKEYSTHLQMQRISTSKKKELSLNGKNY
jgi:hypothetical protein